MKFVSARHHLRSGVKSEDPDPAVFYSQALEVIVASDGGLFVPERFPLFKMETFGGEITFPAFGAKVLAPFFEGDRLEEELASICESAFNFELPLKMLQRQTALLELFHGPTLAFKDFGARFLAECLGRLKPKSQEKNTVLVATSGDTGGAVAGAFWGRPGFDVVILFPKGRVSARQEKQLTAWGDNVRAVAVKGDFDDCQRIVKEAFRSEKLRLSCHLTSANSISVGRLLPQVLYHAWASLNYLRKTGREAGVIVPSGNLGNSAAALWAKRMGFPIREVVLAVNANRAVVDYLEGGLWRPLPTVATLANAMDVGNPSNIERIQSLYPVFQDLKRDVSAVSILDPQIRETIRTGNQEWGEVFCPHTATAIAARMQQAQSDWIIAATAHPAKFETIVEPLIGRAMEVPAELDSILKRPSSSIEIEPSLKSLTDHLAQLMTGDKKGRAGTHT